MTYTKKQLEEMVEHQKRVMTADRLFYRKKYDEWQEEKELLLKQIEELKNMLG